MTRVKERKVISETEEQLYREIVEDYLRCGSVEELLALRRYSVPMSFAEIHRLLDEWGIIKASGPHQPLTQCISFLVRLVEEKIPLETLYRRMPPSFLPSVTTLHRIYRLVKSEVKKKIEERRMRRYGTALVISLLTNPSAVLIARDVSPANRTLGKPFGALSLPMCFAKLGEPKEDSILRVLQQEVFSRQTVARNMPSQVLAATHGLSPFMFLDIADVRVSVNNLVLPDSFADPDRFSSFKLKNFRWVEVGSFLQDQGELASCRQGIQEIFLGYRKYLQAEAKSPIYVTSFLNLRLAALSI